jgi:hypothetical protein
MSHHHMLFPIVTSPLTVYFISFEKLALANAMRFVDDIFDETMQAIKDAGQWDNTIVLLTGKLLLRLRYFINLVFQLLI